MFYMVFDFNLDGMAYCVKVLKGSFELSEKPYLLAIVFHC